MKIVSEKKSYLQNYFGDSKFGMEVDLIETIQKSYILHVRTLKTELGKAPKASARGQCSLVTPLRCALLSPGLCEGVSRVRKKMNTSDQFGDRHFMGWSTCFFVIRVSLVT